MVSDGISNFRRLTATAENIYNRKRHWRFQRACSHPLRAPMLFFSATAARGAVLYFFLIFAPSATAAPTSSIMAIRPQVVISIAFPPVFLSVCVEQREWRRLTLRSPRDTPPKYRRPARPARGRGVSGNIPPCAPRGPARCPQPSQAPAAPGR